MTSVLATDYNLVPGTNPTLLSFYGSWAVMETALPYFAGWATQIGLSQAQQLQVDRFSACHNNQVWKTHGYYPGTPIYTQICNSRSSIEWPDGEWLIRMPLVAALGHYYGQGNSIFVGANPANFTYGTSITPDHANWVGNPTITGPGGIPSRCGIVSATFGETVEGSYAENLRISDVYLDGGVAIADEDPSYESSGILITNSGSCSEISHVRADNWNTAGIHIIHAIPIRIEHCRTFTNNRAGVLFEGCALSTAWVDGIEGDDNTAMIEFTSGRNGQSAGLKTGTFNIKSEQGKNTARGQVIMHLRGQFGVTVMDCSSAVYNNITPDTAFRWETTNNKSSLTVLSFTDCGTATPGGFDNLMRTETVTYDMPPLCRATSFKLMGSLFYTDEQP